MSIKKILNEVDEEITLAQTRFSSMASHHEAYAVIKEELDEYWESVRANKPDRQELIQIAAMVVRTIYDLEFDKGNTKRIKK